MRLLESLPLDSDALHDWPPALGGFSLRVRIPQSKKNRRPVLKVRGGDGKARCDAAGEGLTHHPQRVAVERPSDSIWNRVSNQLLG